MIAYIELPKGTWSFILTLRLLSFNPDIAIVMDTGKDDQIAEANVLFLRLQMSHEPGMRRFLDWERLPPTVVPPWASDIVI